MDHSSEFAGIETITVGEAIERSKTVSDGSGITLIVTQASGDIQYAASVVAQGLNYRLHQVNMETLMGDSDAQTQGNLREVFDNAADGGIVLFFDHADAVFNLDGAEREPDALTPGDYFLQRVKVFNGIVVLALSSPESVGGSAGDRPTYIVAA